MNSLRLRLFAFLLALATVTAVAVGTATYLSVRGETDDLFDYHLRQMALSLRDQGRIDDGERAALAASEFDYVVQIWSVDGLVLYSSDPQALHAPLPPRTVLGFSTVQVGGEPWRVFGAATPLRVIQVGQPLAVRRRLAASAAERSVLPVLVAAPLVGLALWWLLSVSLAPVKRVAGAVQSRDVHSLDPLPEAGLPDEVAPMVRAFNQLLSRLGQAFEAQRVFVADAAHELRTPLTALKLQLGLLRDAGDAAEREAAMTRLRGGIDRAAHLVDQLLALARAEPGHELPQVAVDLAETARQAVADAAALAQAHRARVDVDAAEGVVVRGEPSLLRSLVRNLVDNAVRHAGTAPQVQVRVIRDGAQALLQVDDDGPGIAPAERARAFDRFHRRGEGAGSGLGLAIVQAIARRHGGNVRLDASPRGGLRVEVRLPTAG